MIKKILLGLLIAKSLVFGGEISVCAASDLKFALDEIVKNYETKNKDEKVKVSYGSSGKFTTQILNGAPYQLFFAANIEYPQRLKAAGQTSGEIKPYAIGRLALVAQKGRLDTKKGLEILRTAQINKFSIANPEHAPYGKAAVEILQNSKIYDFVKTKFVLGENIQQATNFVLSGAAEGGIIAYSLLLSPGVGEKLDSYLIPTSLHKEMKQAYVVTKQGEHSLSVKKFIAFFEGKEADTIMKKYGFALE
ncbi:MAG TPA: molybdate ABC transporter substrate-binding protein [Campylobacterales bacterium]|nr:molybdate ABC transporter substrate-binding protein [Campylobacterales bacterium]